MKPRPVDAQHYEVLKLRVEDLRIGMFVCELDRPWVETPFLFEGFELENEADIQAVKQHCEHVYIDLGRTHVLRVKIDTGIHHTFISGKNQSPLEEEIVTAEMSKNETSNVVQSFVEEISFGHSVDLQLAKNAVSHCVESVMRNPDASMLLTRMRMKSQHIAEHAFNVCIYSIILGRLCGLKAKQLEDLGTCGLLHDIGNIAIPDHLLNKPTKLTEEEFGLIKQHTTYGRDILISARNIFPGAVDVAYGHHENLDGSGYPRGLKDESINLNCKIVALVDKYEAITRNTPYRSAQNHLDAVHLLNLMAENNKVDKKLTTTFVSYLGFYPPGTIVELSSGEVGIVLKSNMKQRLKPQVLIVRDVEKSPIENLVDLALRSSDPKGNAYKIKMVHLPGFLGIDLAQYRDAIIQGYD